MIGQSTGGRGTATITGGTWANSGDLTIGYTGTAVLAINGGLVSVGGTLSKGAHGSLVLNSSGTLQIGTGGTTGVLATDLSHNGTLVFNRSDSFTHANTLSGSGALRKAGAGSLNLTVANAFSGGTRVSDGIVRVNHDRSLGSGPITIAENARRLVLGDGVTLTNNIVIDSPASLFANGVVQYEGAGSARIASGTITILRNPDAGGLFGTIGGGTLYVDSPITATSTAAVYMRLGTVVFGGGGNYSEFQVGEGIARLSRDDGIARTALARLGWVQHQSTATLDMAGFDQTLVGIYESTGSATIGNSSKSRSSTLTVTGSSNFSGVIKDSLGAGDKQMSLVVDGGWLGLSGTNTMSGATTVRNGRLHLGHARALSQSVISVLSGGTLTVTPQNVTEVAGIELNDAGLIDVGGGAITSRGGLSESSLVSDLYAGRSGGSWGGYSGITSSIAAASNGSRTVGWVDNGDGSVTFGYAASGDTNLDWRVDVLDVANFISSGGFNTGLPATWAEGDFNYDGYSDILDMGDLISTGLFNAGSYNNAVGTITAVPEPSTIGLLGVGAGIAGLAAARRKRLA
jgi:autotransporter-associated beta strand protein/T5SS/PEP-CTERM-associated repeat protein